MYNILVMKALKIIAIAIVMVAFFWGLVNIIREKITLETKNKTLQATLNNLVKENQNLSSKIEYLQKPENLVKELKSEFNFRHPEEKLIIIVPSTTKTE